MRVSRSTRLAVTFGTSCIALFAALPAAAQTATVNTQDVPAAPAAQANVVVVTGSRTITDGSSAPTPVTVASDEQLQSAQPGSISDALTQLPVFRGSQKPAAAGSAGTTLGAGANLLTLRALSPFRTLVLLDGRRIVPTQLTGSTDANMIPDSLISRVDVVTGGASAAYGSDAVAGVINFVLDTGFEGFKGTVQTGISSRSDGASGKVNLTYGHSFLDDRLHVIVSGDFFQQQGINLDYGGREFAEDGYGLIGASTASSALVIAPDIREALATTGGLITGCQPVGVACPINRMQFTTNGTLAPYAQGSFVTTATMSGGDGVARRTNLIAGYDATSLFSHAAYDLSDNTNIYAEVLYGKVHAQYFGSNSGVSGTSSATIFNDNAYLPTAVRSVLTANNISSFSFARATFDFGGSYYTNNTETYRYVAGLNGSFGGNWKYALYGEYGTSSFDLTTSNNVLVQNFYNALDAVVNPANGQIVCRSTLLGTSAGTGCVPMNLFGEGAASPEALAYVVGSSYLKVDSNQLVFSGDLRGELFSLPGGPLVVATGLEYRKEAGEQSTNPENRITRTGTGIRGYPAAQVNQAGAYQLSPAQALKGSFFVTEGFVEATAPLLRDAPGARRLDLNAAARYADYSSVGGVSTWKVGLNWEPIEGFRLRGTQSQDIRAPSIQERFAPLAPTIGQAANDPQKAGARFVVVQLNQGNPDLFEETAETSVLGAVFAPSFLPGFTASVDHFNIRIEDVIASPTIQSVVDACGLSACSQVIRNPDGTINSVVVRQQNFAQLHTDGEDIEIAYSTALDRLNLPGELKFRLLATHTNRLNLTLGATTINRVGDLNVTPSSNPPGVAEWSGAFSVDYRTDHFHAFVQERYVGPGYLDKTLVYAPTQDTRVSDVFYTDVTLGYRPPALGSAVELYATVNNLFDEQPPLTPNGALTTPRPVNSSVYDVLGRYFTAGMRFSF